MCYYYLKGCQKKHATRDTRESSAEVKENRKAAYTSNMQLQAWFSKRVDTQPEPMLLLDLLRGWEASLQEESRAVCHHQGCTYLAATLATTQHHY